MDALDLALHGLNFIAPAWFLALGLVLATRLWPRRGLGQATLSWQWQLIGLGLMGSLVLLGGLWLLGVDGKMATYGALVCVLACAQWVFNRAWRR